MRSCLKGRGHSLWCWWLQYPAAHFLHPLYVVQHRLSRGDNACVSLGHVSASFCFETGSLYKLEGKAQPHMQRVLRQCDGWAAPALKVKCPDPSVKGMKLVPPRRASGVLGRVAAISTRERAFAGWIYACRTVCVYQFVFVFAGPVNVEPPGDLLQGYPWELVPGWGATGLLGLARGKTANPAIWYISVRQRLISLGMPLLQAPADFCREGQGRLIFIGIAAAGDERRAGRPAARMG